MSMAAEAEKSIQDELSLAIMLAGRVIKSAQEAESFRAENLGLDRQVTELSQLLRSAHRLIATPAGAYDRPIRRVTVGLDKTLDSVLNLARKCRHKKTMVLRHVLSITTLTDFRKVSALLDSLIADIKWVLSIFSLDSDNETINLSLPPSASNDPIIAWVWAYIAAVHLGRGEAANELANLTRDNVRNRKVVVEEQGIPPLLKLLKESKDIDARKAAACALCNLADVPEHVRLIASAHGVQIVSKALSEAPMSVQVELVNLVARMSESNAGVQEEFGTENITRPLVAVLGVDVNLDKFNELNPRTTASSLHSLVQMNENLRKNPICVNGSGGNLVGSGPYVHRKDKDREAELPEVKSRLKLGCAIALCTLARGSLLNSQKITETKALLILATIIEKEQGDLQMNCLLLVMELTAVAETNADLKRSAFKPNTPAAKAVLDQLLRLINEETSAPLVKPAVKAIGCLAKMFAAKETRIIMPLVSQLGNVNPEVAAEAAKSLNKFVCKDNFNRTDNSKAIIEFDGVSKLMNSIRNDEGGHLHLPELVLLCHLAINAGNSKALEQARALHALEGTARHAVAHNPDLRELFSQAIHQLTLYQPAVHIRVLT